MNQLSVVLARFPFTNQIDYKIRPVVVISNSKFNGAHNFCWACPITSKASLKEFELEISKAEFTGELKTQSFIRTDTIASMEKELFLKEIGKITPTLFEKLKKELIKNL
ncbi:MAG: type II toxin-antitoxin system PemK/MazF family toxin [Candidatus Diapherotrites archaeon]|nr:type II toxin-antitoxin system PemK/MazF family toxin [Candidatus Diapherotrites archaeon]